jgi:hypothetical protein
MQGKPEDLFQDLGQAEERMLQRQRTVDPTSGTIVQKESAGKALIIKDFRKFHKHIPFDQVQEQISLLSLSLIDLNPSNLGNKFDTILGHNGTTYVMTQWRMSAAQSINRCEEIGGTLANLQIIAEENLQIRRTVVTGDSIFIANNSLSCYMSGVTMYGIGCIRNMYHYAKMSGRKIGATPNELYKSCLNDYPNGSELRIFVSQDMVQLDVKEDVSALCKVDLHKGVANREPLATVIQDKYFTHLSSLFSELITHFEYELDSLRDITLKSIKHQKLKLQKFHSSAEICNLIKRDRFKPIITSAADSALSMDEFFRLHGSQLTSCAREYYQLTESIVEMCYNLPYELVFSVYANILATRKHFQKQVSSFSGTQSRGKYTDNILFLTEDSFASIPLTLTVIVGTQLSEAEVSYFFISMYNIMLRFCQSTCELLEISCSSLKYIHSNALHQSMQLSKITKHFIRRSSPAVSSTAGSADNSLRSKRWIFSPFLSAVSGLASETEI